MKSLLVVDDDTMRADWFAKALSPLGHDVRLAFDAQLALDQLRETAFDIVFLDHDLGLGLNGSQLLYKVLCGPKSYNRPKHVWIHSENPIGVKNIASKAQSAGLSCQADSFGMCKDNEAAFILAVRVILNEQS